MKKIIVILIFTLAACSENKQSNQSITIDLKEHASAIPYSLFADSLNYLTLKMNNNSFVSNVNRLYIEDDLIFLESEKEGIFAYSNKFVLLNYFNLDWTPSYWVLLDKTTNQTIVSHNLKNDFNDIQITSTNLFYINNKMWCRILDFEEDNPNLSLEFIKH